MSVQDNTDLVVVTWRSVTWLWT